MAGMMGDPEKDYSFLQEFSERLGLDDKQREGFINESMQRFGYKPKTSWEPGEEENNDGGGSSFFGGGGKQRGGGGRQQQQQRGSDSGGWQYS